jgi:glycogen operon protein
MLLHGDELGRTQGGNNNAYCHDTELSWVDWSITDENAAFLRFTQEVMAFRRANPAIRQLRFTAGQQSFSLPALQADARDMVWFSATGNEMQERAWSLPSRKYLALYVSGSPMAGAVLKHSYLILFNASDGVMNVTIPDAHADGRWAVVVDTYVPVVVDVSPSNADDQRVTSAGADHRIEANSLQVLQCINRNCESDAG